MPRKRTGATVEIKIYGAGPKYKVKFTPAKGRVHAKGHLWLADDGPDFIITFIIKTPNFTFDDGGMVDPTQSIFIDTSPKPSDFNALGVFSGLALGNSNASLSVTDKNADQRVYFYRLNFLDPTGKPFNTDDPIIVNN